MENQPSNNGYISPSSNFMMITPYPQFAYEPTPARAPRIPLATLDPNCARQVFPQNLPSVSSTGVIDQNCYHGAPCAIIQEFGSPPRVPTINCDENVHYVVCDTNIFMHSMEDIWRILNFVNCKLVIPWKIHKELDGLKKNYDWQRAKCARDAAKQITYILQNFGQKVYCQDRFQYDKAKTLFVQEDSDDSIIQSILQLQEIKNRVIYLHTNDVVLKNKALSIGLSLFKF